MKANFEKFGTVNEDGTIDFNAKLTDADLESAGGGKFRLLPEGEYPFTVDGILFDKAKTTGSNMIKLTLNVHADGGDVIVRDNIILTPRAMWKAAQFFACIGMFEDAKKNGMNWDKTVDKSGTLVIGHHTYDGKDYNDVTAYLLPTTPVVG